ncbi:MAG: ester cyclase [Spirochaetia bacterium]|nr:ester cyclase [Spirochaetia bacterium]
MEKKNEEKKTDNIGIPQKSKLKIEFDGYEDISSMLQTRTDRRQSLKGFDDDYSDIVDYIVRCTYKIWDEHNVGLIYTHYASRSLAHMPHGLVYGREKVIEATLAAQNAFPDFKLFVDDVIWRGDDEKGFDTSMPSTGVGTNTGWSMYGPPSNKSICRRGIANCFTKENRIIEEWVVHDDAAAVEQLGFDLDTVISNLVESGYCYEGEGKEPAAIERVHGEETPKPLPPLPKNENDVEGLIQRAFQEIFNWRMIGRVDSYFSSRYTHHGCRGKDYYGRGEYKKLLLSWLAMFPDAEFIIEDIYWNGDSEKGFRSSTRWKIIGTHRGNGVYGYPSQARVEIMGITNHIIKNGKFVEALSLYNDLETAVRIERARRKNGVFSSMGNANENYEVSEDSITMLKQNRNNDSTNKIEEQNN